MKITLILLFSILSLSIVFAQPDLSKIPAVDSIYQDYIRTIEFRNTRSELSMPIINLKGGRLHVGFDDSYGEYIDYYYTVIHCDKEWNYTQDIEVSEYLEGPDNIQIENFASSVRTIMNYNHFEFQFPNNDIAFRWSGNYLLVVYDADETVAFTRRFYIYDNKVPILNPKYTQPIAPGTYDSHQAFNFQLQINTLNPLNPTEELCVTGFQNRLNEQTSTFKYPMLVQGKNAIFNFKDQLTFPGLKEYRFFDTRGILTAGLNVNHIDISNTHAMVLLQLDKDRSVKPNFTREESNGGYIIRNDDRQIGSPNVSAEYPHILFTLKAPEPTRGDVYVVGEFNDFKIHKDFRMQHLTHERAYSLEVPLKQGYYNYLYAVHREGEPLDFFRYEGSSFETENIYHFFVYYRPRGSEYDQIVGYLEYPHNPN